MIPSSDATSLRTGQPDQSKLSELIRKLSEAVDENDTVAIEHCQTLHRYLDSFGMEEHLDSLIDSLDRYDFDQADEDLSHLRERLGAIDGTER